jgi:uncharacterized protein (UPF0335 family)
VDLSNQNNGINMTVMPAAAELRNFVERIEAQNARIKDETDARKEIYDEAGGRGYSKPILRELVKLRAMKPDDRAEREAVLGLYLSALGMS